MVSFGYELETTPVSETVLQEEILPTLEHAFNDFLVPLLFADQCSGRRSLSRRLGYVGISARPDDLPIVDVVCGTLKDEGNRCRVILGELSLYLDSRRLNEEDEIREYLKRGMKDDEFVGAEERIVRVSYVDLSTVDTSVTFGQGPEDSSDEEGVNALLVGFVSAFAGTILIGGILAYRRRRKKEHDGAVSVHSGPESLHQNSLTEKGSNETDPHNGTEEDDDGEEEAASSTASVYLEHDTPSTLKMTDSMLDSTTLDNTILGVQSPTDSEVYLDSPLGSLPDKIAKKNSADLRFL